MEELLTRGVSNIYPSKESLKERLSSGAPLHVYLGIDPTSPSLHLGHAIPLKKMAQFQALGHKVTLLIGDFTATIGDPTGKAVARTPLSREKVLENALLYKKQASRILKFSGQNPASLKHNSKWLAKLSFAEILSLASKITFAQIIKRDMFQKRIEENRDLYLHEFLYPLMQGYDSVAMDVDGEVGGNDQIFNMLVGRDLMKKIKGKEKFVLAMKLLEDPSGVKMGKTAGNAVAFSDSGEDIYGKVMSWPDGMIRVGFELITDLPMTEVDKLENEAGARDSKMRLALEVVKMIHGESASKRAEKAFVKTFQKKELPDEIKETTALVGEELGDVLLACQLVKSKSDFRRLVFEGAISVETGQNELKINEPHFKIDQPLVVRIGKRRFLKIKIV